MAYRFNLPLADVGDGITPADGAKLYFVEVGTSTPKTVYSDFALTTPSPATGNAIIADAEGVFPPLFLDGQADVSLYDKNDVQIWGPETIYDPEDSISTATFFPDSDSITSLITSLQPTAAEIALPATIVDSSYPPGDWRRYGAVDDAAIDGTTGTDSTAAIQMSLDMSAEQPSIGPPGNYLFSNLTMPGPGTLVGTGMHTTNMVCKVGSTGTMFTDQGSAAKITIKDISFYGNDIAYTKGFDIGNGITQVFGTEGKIHNVWVRDLPSGFPGIYIRGNVGDVGRLVSWSTGGISVVGPAMMVDKIVNLDASGFTETDTATVTTGLELGDCQVNALEVEAPQTNTIPVYVGRNASIDSLTISLAASTTHSHLVEIAANSTTHKIGNLDLIFASGTGATITNGNFLDVAESRYYGGNASSKNAEGEGNYASSMRLAGDLFEIKSQAKQSFSIRVTNTAGTIQHRIGQPGNSAGAGNFHFKVNAASTTLTNTPTGADASTAFATGAKIGSATTHYLHLDTANQLPIDSILDGRIDFNNTGTAYSVIAVITGQTDINGTTRARLAMSLQNATTGANVAWATALGSPSDIIDVRFNGYLA